MEKIILKHALINAIEHNGKADFQSVLGKVIAEDPSLKEKIGELIPKVKITVEEVNLLSLEKQRTRLENQEVKIEEKKVEQKGLPPLPNVENYEMVVMRLAPFPSGPLHIGNVRVVLLNDYYVKKYKGKLLLVIDDTIGSEEKFIVPKAYELIVDGLKWLGVKWDKLFFKSDRLELYYRATENLIKKNLAYVCECDAETLRKNRMKGIECKHRNQDPEYNLKKWNQMLAGKYGEGDIVVRLKTDIRHENPAFRDRVLLRIADRKHPRVGRKYKVWPLLELSWAIDDHLLGITHILRGKDLIMEDLIEDFIWSRLGVQKAEFIHCGLLSIREAKLSKTAARKAIERKEFLGWDDPRTWSLQSLRRRGIQPEAIKKFIIGMGLSLADVTVPAEILYAENRKVIDHLSNRYFAIINPVKFSIKNGPKIKKIDALLHPDFPARGNRKIPINIKKIYIEKEDLKKYRNNEVGLINLFSVELKKKMEFFSKEIKIKKPKIQWVSEPNVKIKIIMPDGSIKQAIAELGIKKAKVNDLIQLVRIGFCRVDKTGREIKLCFAHR